MISANFYISSAVLAFACRVAAHGQVTGIVAGGKYYQGYVPSVQGSNPHPKLAGWSIPKDSSNGPVYPDGYNTPDIICHLDAKAGAVSVEVEAGATVELEWTEWPETHHGPVIDYLANCNGPCETTDKSSLKFNKIDAVGLLEQSTGPGTAGSWGSDRLRIRNNTWTVTIPSTIAEGSYVLRHEIIALHSARTVNGAQNYPHCINLQVTGSGADKLPSGTLGTALYKPGEPGIQVDIYRPLQYQMPGPPLYTTGTSASGATTADSGLGGGLDNMGMGGGVSASISVASQTMSTASSAAANAVSASISVYTSTTSPLATTTPFATASAPYSNSTGSNTTMTMSYSPITSSISIAAASSSPLPIPEALQTAVSLVNNVSQATESIQVNEAAAQTTYPSTSAQMPAATTPTATSSPLDIPVQQATSAAAAATTSATSKTYPSLPLNPTPALLSGMSVSELMLYLKAIVAELSNKLSTNQSKRRRHARDVISSR